jgi:hypothetical protein
MDAIMTSFCTVPVGLLIVRVSTPDAAPADDAATKAIFALTSEGRKMSAAERIKKKVMFLMSFAGFIVPPLSLMAFGWSERREKSAL